MKYASKTKPVVAKESFTENPSEENMRENVDVVVVGAGISGLVATNDLLHYDKTLKVLLLEASDRIGGKIQSVQDQGQTFDVGAQVIKESQKNVFQLLDSLGLRQQLTQTSSYFVSYFGEKPKFIWTPLAVLESIWLRRKIEKLADKVDPRYPYQDKSFAEALDGTTVRDFLNSNSWFENTRAPYEFVVKVAFGCETSSVSMLYFLMYLNSTGGMSKMSGDTFTLQGGLQRVCVKLVDKIGSQNVLLNQPVSSVVSVEANKMMVTTKTQDTFVCRAVILTTSMAAVNSMEFSPPLASSIKFTLASFSPGNMTKVSLIYDTPHWRNHHKRAPKKVARKSGPFQVLSEIEVPKSDQESFMLTGLIAGNQSLKLSEKSREEVKNCLVDYLSDYYQENWPMSAKQFVAKHWQHEDFLQGTVCSPRPGCMRHLHQLRRPCKGVYFAGTETATRWIGHVSGAIQSGQRAAIQVIDELRPQALSAQDYRFLKEIYISPEEERIWEDGEKFNLSHRVYRWTLLLPLICCGLGYAAFAFRDKYCGLFVPIHH